MHSTLLNEQNRGPLRTFPVYLQKSSLRLSIFPLRGDYWMNDLRAGQPDARECFPGDRVREKSGGWSRLVTLQTLPTRWVPVLVGCDRHLPRLLSFLRGSSSQLHGQEELPHFQSNPTIGLKCPVLNPCSLTRSVWLSLSTWS